MLAKRLISKKAFWPPTQIVHHLSFFFSEPSAKMADADKLLWAQMLYIICVSASVPLIAIKRCCLWVSSFVYIVEHHFISQPHAWASLLVMLVDDQVLTAIDFVEYRLLVCSRTTHAKLLTCYGYMMAKLTRILGRSQSVLCCCTPVTSSHCCLCIHHVALL